MILSCPLIGTGQDRVIFDYRQTKERKRGETEEHVSNKKHKNLRWGFYR